MCVYVSVCVCVRVCVCVFVCMYLCVRICVYMCVCMYACEQVSVFVCSCMCACVCVNACMRACMSVCVCVCVIDSLVWSPKSYFCSGACVFYMNSRKTKIHIKIYKQRVQKSQSIFLKWVLSTFWGHFSWIEATYTIRLYQQVYWEL